MRKQTQIGMIDTLVNRGMTRWEIYTELKPMVLDQIRPMVFKVHREDGMRGMVPLRIHPRFSGDDCQTRRLWYQIGRRLQLAGYDVPDEDMPDEGEAPRDNGSRPEQRPESRPEQYEHESQTEESESEQEEDEDYSEPVPDIKPGREDPMPYFLREVRRIRQFCEDRSGEISDLADFIGMRPVTEAWKAFHPAIDIHPDVMLNAMCLHWSDDAKSEARVPVVNMREHSKPLAPGYHYLTGHVHKLMLARIPVLLIGGTGVSKSYTIKQVAGYMELPYDELPFSEGIFLNWLLGQEGRDGTWRARPLIEFHANGGVFNAEEIDAGDPNALLVANQIQQDEFSNPASGKRQKRHPNFILAATANTTGLGATRAHNARNKLDDATLDRFRMGRVMYPLDEQLETYLANREYPNTLAELHAL